MDPFLAANVQFAIRLDRPITAPVTLVLHFSYTMYQKDVGYHLTAYTAADGTQMLLGATHMQACTLHPQPSPGAPALCENHLTACSASDGSADAAASHPHASMCFIVEMGHAMLISYIYHQKGVGHCVTSISPAAMLATGRSFTMAGQPHSPHILSSLCATLTKRVSAVQPVYARQAFPCFDEPWMKATFQLTLLTDPSVPMALYNMPLLHGSGKLDASTGLREWRFGTSPVMSSYLVAFALGESLQVNPCTICKHKDICNCHGQIPEHLSS